MRNRDHQNDQNPIANFVNDLIISNTNPPKILSAAQFLAALWAGRRR